MPPQQLMVILQRFTKYITITVLLFCAVVTVDVPKNAPFSDLKLKFLDTLTRVRFDVMNKSDVDSLMTLVSKTVRRGRAFSYLWKLHEAMSRETKRSDDLEDSSSKDWIIQAFRPSDVYNDDTISFDDCTVCGKKKELGNRCNVTRVELLVPVLPSDSGNETLNESVTVEINGQSIDSYAGTMDISRAVIFDLSSYLLKGESDTRTVTVKVTNNRLPCQIAYPKRSMLYEYCNMNRTILQRFRSKGHEWNNEQQRDDIDGYQSENDLEDQISFETHMKNLLKVAREKLLQKFETNDMQDLENFETSDMQDLENFETSDMHNSENKYDSYMQDLYRRRRRSLRENNAAPVKLHKNISRKLKARKRQIRMLHTRRHVRNHRNLSSKGGFQKASGECRRHSFSVSLQHDLFYTDVIEPLKKIDIGYCAETCRHANHFSNVNDYLTAHAVIVNSMHGPAPEVRCSPRKLSSMSIMKFNHMRGSIIVENLANIKIESCWCT